MYIQPKPIYHSIQFNSMLHWIKKNENMKRLKYENTISKKAIITLIILFFIKIKTLKSNKKKIN